MQIEQSWIFETYDELKRIGLRQILVGFYVKLAYPTLGSTDILKVGPG